MNADPDRGFYCIDWAKEDISLMGTFKYNSYDSIDIIMLPCHVTHNRNPDDFVSDECIPNFEEQKKYLGPINIVFLMNESYFDQTKFGEDSIVNRSVIVNKQVS